MKIRLSVSRVEGFDSYCAGLAKAMLAAGVVTAEVLEIDRAVYRQLRQTHCRPRGLGDIVEAFAKPIAKVLRLSCLDAQGNLKPESGCAQRRAWLNGKPKTLT